MILTIDIGNTHTVFAVFKGAKIAHQWRMETRKTATQDELAAFLLPLMNTHNVKIKTLTSIIVASVSPSCDASMTRLCTEYLGHDPVFITHENAGITVNFPHANQVGADRLVNAVAVIEEGLHPAIVIDFGTATTFDVIDANGAYCGGMIAPGIHLSMKALTDKAAKLGPVAVEKPASALGTSTTEAMQAGLFYGYLGLIEKNVSMLSQAMNTTPTVIATGGLGRLFINETEAIHHYDPDLTLKGLLSLSKRIC